MKQRGGTRARTHDRWAGGGLTPQREILRRRQGGARPDPPARDPAHHSWRPPSASAKGTYASERLQPKGQSSIDHCARGFVDYRHDIFPLNRTAAAAGDQAGRDRGVAVSWSSIPRCAAQPRRRPALAPCLGRSAARVRIRASRAYDAHAVETRLSGSDRGGFCCTLPPHPSALRRAARGGTPEARD